MQRKLLGIISVDLEGTCETSDHINFICQVLRKKWKHNAAVNRLLTDFKKFYDSVSKDGLCNITSEFVIPM